MIPWNVNPEIFSIGFISVRWYGLLFATAFLAGFQIFTWIYKNEKKNLDDLNTLIWYMMVGTIVGARLGHCFFYNPVYYLSNPFEILAVWKGGLASHGASIGILTALWMYTKKKPDQPYLWLLDRMVIVAALGGSFIRLGNLFNSEIIGVKTDVAWAFVFKQIDNVPRHPAQLYESIAYLITFIILWSIYKKFWKKLSTGTIFGLFLILVFGFRFFVEFIKEDQSSFEAGMALNMGQLLSIPLVLTGLYFLLRNINSSRKEEKGAS